METYDFADTQRLQLLRELDPLHRWRSLDEHLHCVLCEQTISGHNLRLVRSRTGLFRLSCATPGCTATPREWVHPANPLISEEAWHDWVRLLDSLCDEEPRTLRRPSRRFRPCGTPTASALDKTPRLMKSGWQR